MEPTNPIVIDTDAGADDLLALILGLQSSLKNILGIVASYGNFQTKESLSRISSLFKHLELAHSPTLVRGSSNPLKKNYQTYYQIHGKKWINEKTKDKPQELASFVRTLDFQPQKFDYICLGPLTNLAKILKTDLKEKIEHVYIMGGTLLYPGNATPLSEANFFWDPKAVTEVFALAADKINLFPLNITDQLQLGLKKIKSLKDNRLIRSFFRPYYHFYTNKKGWHLDPKDFSKKKYKGAAIHDVSPVAYLLNNDIFKFKNVVVSTKLTQKIEGVVVPILRKDQIELSQDQYSLKVASEIDENLFWETVIKPLNST